jgi:hypothetical protein
MNSQKNPQSWHSQLALYKAELHPEVATVSPSVIVVSSDISILISMLDVKLDFYW